MTPENPSQRARPGLLPAAVALLALAALVMWPALGAGFLQDDWDFLASSTHLPSPLPYFLENYSRGYFHRPNGMLAWWLLTRAFGLASYAHYAVQIGVHAGCALALLALMLRLGATRRAAFVTAGLFVLHPATVATSLWLSNRFDLLAALGILACLRLAFSPRLGSPHVYVGLAACAWLAVGSKEIGVLVLPLALLALWLRPEIARRTRVAAALAVLLPVAAWFALRLAVLGSDDVTSQRDLAALGRQLATGVELWFHYLPGALALDAPAWLGTAAGLVLAGAGLASLAAGRPDSRSRRSWLGLALLLLPPLLQWPITHVALGMPDALGISVSLRFYFLSLCGAALLLSVALDLALGQGDVIGRRFAPRSAAVLALAALVAVPVAVHARQRSQAWMADTGNPQALRMEASLAHRFRTMAGGAGCKLVFEGAASANLPGFADHIAKAHLPRGHRAIDSLVVTQPMPWSAIVGPAGATPAALSPLPNRMTGPLELLPARVGPLFYVSLDYRPLVAGDPAGCAPLTLRWDGNEFVDAGTPAQVPAQ